MPQSVRASSILLAAVVQLAIGSSSLAQAVRVPGTSVSLAPPAGFVPAQQYPGFEHASEHASIMVTELPGPAPDMMRAMSREALATRGMALVGAQDVVIDGRPARLLNVRQQTANGDVFKWLLIAGDEGTTIMIVGMFPVTAQKSTGDAIRHALLTMSRGSGIPSAFEGLAFRVTPTARLKLAKRVSNMLTFTESGTMGSPGSTEALYLVGHSIGQGQIGDLQQFSDIRARQTTLIKNLTNVSGRQLLVDGLEAYELGADAIDARTGAAMRLYQVIVPDETGYFIIQGLTRAGTAREMLPEFQTVTASFRRNSSR